MSMFMHMCEGWRPQLRSMCAGCLGLLCHSLVWGVRVCSVCGTRCVYLWWFWFFWVYVYLSSLQTWLRWSAPLYTPTSAFGLVHLAPTPRWSETQKHTNVTQLNQEYEVCYWPAVRSDRIFCCECRTFTSNYKKTQLQYVCMSFKQAASLHFFQTWLNMCLFYVMRAKKCVIKAELLWHSSVYLFCFSCLEDRICHN